MEERKIKVNFFKSGSGSINGKIALPVTWMRDMGLTLETPEIHMLYDDKTKQILIKKAK